MALVDRLVFTTWFAVALTFLLVDTPMIPAVQADVAEDAAAERFIDLVDDLAQALPATGATHGSPGTRSEADGSVTVLGPIDDLPGTIARTPFSIPPEVTAEIQIKEAGMFTRTWTDGGRQVVTIGTYVRDETGHVTNLNTMALEGWDDLDDAAIDVAANEAVPLFLNVLPFLLNYAQPTSFVLFVGLALGVIAAAVLILALGTAGFGELAAVLLYAYVIMILAPLFYFGLYPIHLNHRGEETYRSFPDAFVWQGLKRAAGIGVWQGTYLSRAGGYAESVSGSVEAHLIADAWKRAVIGPVTRVDTDTVKHPGMYLRQDIHRDWSFAASGMDFEATNTITAGAYHDAVGESPGVTVHMQEHKSGDQVFLYAPQHEDTISVGVTADGTYVPLIGTRTSAWHRVYNDVTNQGQTVAAIEAYRETNYGLFVDGAYVPVAGIDVWSERAPLDMWALGFGLAGPGDQLMGDLQWRTGYYVDDRFVALAGGRVDDDFDGHRYTYRSMVSAGLFVTDPTDPGPAVPGEAPDGATYIPLVATTYDGKEPLTLWALSSVGGDAAGRNDWLVSAGLRGGADYIPLVGVEFEPRAEHGTWAGGETYRVGVFPADYATFIPLAGASWGSDQTSLAWAQSASAAHTSGTPREASVDLAEGAYVAGDFVPLAWQTYDTQGRHTHPFGHHIVFGIYDPNGSRIPLVEADVAMDQAPGTWTPPPGPCQTYVAVRVVPLDEGASLVPPCTS